MERRREGTEKGHRAQSGVRFGAPLYSEHLTAMGRCDESITELRLAGVLDPLSLVISADLGRAFYYAREYDQVMKQEARTLEMDPNFWLSHINLGRSHTQIGNHADAISELKKAHELS